MLHLTCFTASNMSSTVCSTYSPIRLLSHGKTAIPCKEKQDQVQ